MHAGFGYVCSSRDFFAIWASSSVARQLNEIEKCYLKEDSYLIKLESVAGRHVVARHIWFVRLNLFLCARSARRSFIWLYYTFRNKAFLQFLVLFLYFSSDVSRYPADQLALGPTCAPSSPIFTENKKQKNSPPPGTRSFAICEPKAAGPGSGRPFAIFSRRNRAMITSSEGRLWKHSLHLLN